jgi:capsule polysaccharide modification protein KpsS
VGSPVLNEESVYRLEVRDEDKDFFRDNIQNPESIRKFLSQKTKLVDSKLRYFENTSKRKERNIFLDIERKICYNVSNFLIWACIGFFWRLAKTLPRFNELYFLSAKTKIGCP